MSEKNDELIDQLTKEYNEGHRKQRRPPRNPQSRPGTKKKEKEPSALIPAVIDEGTRAYNIAKMLRNGTDSEEVATKYGIEQRQLRAIMEEAMGRLYEETSLIAANWLMVTFARLEDQVRQTIPKTFSADGTPNDQVQNRLQQLIAQQKTLIEMIPRDQDGNGKPVGITPTMVSGSTLYSEGAVAIQEKYRSGDIQREKEIADLDNLFEKHGIIAGKTSPKS